jgi:hypothetical protein
MSATLAQGTFAHLLRYEKGDSARLDCEQGRKSLQALPSSAGGSSDGRGDRPFAHHSGRRGALPITVRLPVRTNLCRFYDRRRIASHAMAFGALAEPHLMSAIDSYTMIGFARRRPGPRKALSTLSLYQPNSGFSPSAQAADRGRR